MKLVHGEGRQLQQALQARAEEELAVDENAAACLLPLLPTKTSDSEPELASEAPAADVVLLGFPGLRLSSRTQFTCSTLLST